MSQAARDAQLRLALELQTRKVHNNLTNLFDYSSALPLFIFKGAQDGNCLVESFQFTPYIGPRSSDLVSYLLGVHYFFQTMADKLNKIATTGALQ
jgi:hypothetical protein